MAKHLTDKQKKQIIADYVECGSYNAVAKKWKVSATTVKNTVLKDQESVEKCEHKKEENTQDILAFMDSKKELVCLFIDKCLNAMMSDEKLASASINQISTAMGTTIDKFTKDAQRPPDTSLFDSIAKTAGGFKVE